MLHLGVSSFAPSNTRTQSGGVESRFIVEDCRLIHDVVLHVAMQEISLCVCVEMAGLTCAH